MDPLVVPHDPVWRESFESASALVMRALGSNAIAVHHIGSTAISGVWAKPVIDMLVAVEELGVVDGCRAAMAELGYEWKGEYGIPSRRYFRRHDRHGRRTHHLHVFPSNNERIARHLAFRDFLIAHPEWAARYSDLKRDLAKRFPKSGLDYSAGKATFIERIDALAAKWRGPAAK